MASETPAKTEGTTCPLCDAALPDEGDRCPRCGQTLVGTRLYNPKHFVWLAPLLSMMVPVYLAASNWGRLGKTRTKWQVLGLGFLGLISMFVGLSFLPDSGGRAAGYLINIPVAYVLMQKQRPLYAGALRLGARPASLFVGSIIGLGFVALALVLVIGVPMSAQLGYEGKLNHGIALMKQEKHQEARAVFDELTRQHPEGEANWFNRALCDLVLGQWTEAGVGFERYVQLAPKDNEGLAWLAYARAHEGRGAEAESLALVARRAEPHIFRRVFGAEDSLAIELDGSTDHD